MTHVETLIAFVKDRTNALPNGARLMLEVLIQSLASLKENIAVLDAEIARRAKEDPVARRLTTVPGVGPITAAAIAALAPQAESFKRGRDFAAWLGLTPLQRSTGGKTRLGATSKMVERTIRRLLIIGASAVVRQACRRSAASSPWLNRMLARKPRMLVTVAAANKTARIIWALLEGWNLSGSSGGVSSRTLRGRRGRRVVERKNMAHQSVRRGQSASS